MLEKSGAMASVEVSYPKSSGFLVIWHPVLTKKPKDFALSKP